MTSLISKGSDRLVWETMKELLKKFEKRLRSVPDGASSASEDLFMYRLQFLFGIIVYPIWFFVYDSFEWATDDLLGRSLVACYFLAAFILSYNRYTAGKIWDYIYVAGAFLVNFHLFSIVCFNNLHTLYVFGSLLGIVITGFAITKTRIYLIFALGHLVWMNSYLLYKNQFFTGQGLLFSAGALTVISMIGGVVYNRIYLIRSAKESEASFAALAENTVEAIFAEKNGVIVNLNKAAELLVGQRESVLGKSIENLISIEGELWPTQEANSATSKLLQNGIEKSHSHNIRLGLIANISVWLQQNRLITGNSNNYPEAGPNTKKSHESVLTLPDGRRIDAEIFSFKSGHLRTKQNIYVIRDVSERKANERLVLEQKNSLLRLFELEGEAAKAVQSAMLPGKVSHPKFDMEMVYNPADKTGGDFYHYVASKDDRYHYFFLGDVSGHGAAAGLMVGVAVGASSSDLDTHLNPETGLIQTLKTLNNIFFRMQEKTQKFMTMVAVCFDIKTGELFVANAGHIFPLVKTSTGVISITGSRGNPLGYSDLSEFNVCKTQLKKDDMLLLSTDGLTDPGIMSGPISRRKLKSMFIKEKNPHDLLQAIEKIVAENRQDFTDDIAYIILKSGVSEANVAA